ncbi:hypothetical protein phiST2_0258 [Vibrio phage phi-ST2]|uniref:Uncharacterized protein n=2 Tax=Schizotequatrovirus TaxID=1198137 RepID=A0A126HGZ2_9CAUD|nr:hypothetical protein CF80_gp233 [Vibrio phage VH7D]ALP47142.1 hypothetical protein phiGrn1_0128 [Vibrio phage phi-Grn1]ALP47529.1 hypothetical protein phiST2_0258 [Vibrio phage phi-ST2]QBX06076.1 hypothetical protein Va3_122 [Vibrio phage Va3]QNJ55088.1 hypothetical protein vBValMR11Z_162 [Vibrio phage vB_ValM_R11Z]URQ03597.1 hypothetical protein PVA23_220 [Vibrio phage PVA23]
MLYINLTTCSVIDEHSVAEQWRQEGHTVESRRDWKTLERVTEVCNMLDQDLYMVVDAGSGCLPRFDIIKKPRVGDSVSYCFNGDSHPDGVITKISKTMKMITTSTGGKYYRRKLSGQWVRGGCWTLVHGHTSKINWEF